MLFRETVAVYCQNHRKHTNTLCVKNSDLEYFKGEDTYGTTGHYVKG
jgi:hypothetical protein